MYACVPRTERGYFEGVCPPCESTAYFGDPPPLPAIRGIASCLYCLGLCGLLPLTAGNVYSPLRYLVLGNKLQGGGIGRPPLP